MSAAAFNSIEELPPSPPPPAPTPLPPTSCPSPPAQSTSASAELPSTDSDDEGEGDDSVWWTPSELRVSLAAAASQLGEAR